MPTGSSSLSSGTSPTDSGRWVDDKLIVRSNLLHRFPQMAEDRTLPSGMSKTAYFIQYTRTDQPMAPLTEGSTPSETSMSITEKNVVPDQWGLFIALTDVVVLTTKHPVLNEAVNLIGDAVARVEDASIVEVLNAGTNVQYWDGSRATRGAVTATDTFKKEVLAKALATLRDAGAYERDGTFFHALVGPQVEADIFTEASLSGNWSSYASLHAAAGKLDPMEKGVVGAWYGMKVLRTNFIPKFTRIATVSAPTPGAGGSLSGTVYFKVTRKSTQRGFEEDIQVEGSQAMGGNNRLPFVFPATSGYVYNVYAGSATGDVNLKLAASNQLPSATYNLDALPSSGATPPATPAASVTVHPVYIFGKECLDWVPLNGMSLKSLITPAGPSDSDPLAQRRKVGSKYMAKAGIRQPLMLLRVELASNY